MTTECRLCGGTGAVKHDGDCPDCGGTGHSDEALRAIKRIPNLGVLNQSPRLHEHLIHEAETNDEREYLISLYDEMWAQDKHLR